MQRDDKPVPLGAAVMWINASRRSERGHIVAAATRYATVLREDGARLRIRWGALLADDRAPLRTIVTYLDRAQVRFAVGDDVVFTTRDGSTHVTTGDAQDKPERTQPHPMRRRQSDRFQARHMDPPSHDTHSPWHAVRFAAFRFEVGVWGWPTNRCRLP